MDGAAIGQHGADPGLRKCNRTRQQCRCTEKRWKHITSNHLFSMRIEDEFSVTAERKPLPLVNKPINHNLKTNCEK
jgi:hypothetical protein